MPNASRPPTTPKKTSKSGMSDPLRMSIGRSTLSILLTKIAHTNSAIAHPPCPDQYAHTTAASSTGKGPIWPMQSTKTSAVRTVAKGTPTTARPIPARQAWTSAVTMIPSATPRIACAASRAERSPCCPRHALSEAPRRFGGRLAGRVKDGREENDQQELHQHHPDAAHRANEPAEHLLRIGRQARRELFAFDRGGLLPLRGESGTGQGQSHEPVRRRGHGPGGQRPGPTGNVLGVHDDRAEGERERQDQAEQQDRRHHGHR